MTDDREIARRAVDFQARSSEELFEDMLEDLKASLGE